MGLDNSQPKTITLSLIPFVRPLSRCDIEISKKESKAEGYENLEAYRGYFSVVEIMTQTS